MRDYRHHVSGFFVECSQAQAALEKLLMRGLPAQQLRIFDHRTDRLQPDVPASSQAGHPARRKDPGLGGFASGADLDVLTDVALVPAHVTLLVAGPLLAPLTLLGWGASLDDVVVSNSRVRKHGRLADLVEDAIMEGQVVLVAETLTEYQTVMTQELLQRALDWYPDAGAA